MNNDPTPPTPPGDGAHVPLEELSALADGELDEGRAGAVLGHLSGCRSCAETAAVLGDVRQLLLGLEADPPAGVGVDPPPGVGSVPPAGAKQAAVAMALEAVRPSSDSVPGAVVNLPVRRPGGGRWHKVAGIAAAVILAAGAASGVGYALSSSGGRSAGKAASSKAPSGALLAPLEVRRPVSSPHRLGAVEAMIARGDVKTVQLVQVGHGHDDLVVTLRAGRESIVDAIGSGGTVAVGASALGSVRALGPLRIEITGLNPGDAAELRNALGG